MKLVILACLAVVALAAPQEPRPIEIIHDSRRDDGDGNFAYEFETENGIYKNIVGRPAENGGQHIEGSFRFTLDDGTLAEYTFVAGENGYQPESNLIPTPHPLPDHVVHTLGLIEKLVQEGATWNDQGERLTRRK
ncbi:cuticle protein AM1274-like [Panulirus ornatus]|uniref:cuticle protein AM1274-like n=1 Tax=Panulirus ornatus TaxID=150431 RepID=UPI003A8C2B0C